MRRVEVVFTARRVDRPGAHHGPTGRFGGANLSRSVADDPSAVDAHRAALAQRLGVDRDRLVFMAQVHGGEVAVLDAEVPATLADAGVPAVDALVTAQPGVALVVLVADCVPVVLADDDAGVVGVAHAGRRGVQADVVGRAVAAMARLGARPAEVEALLGPAVCGGCYEVPPELQEEVAALVPPTRCTTSWGTPGLDLRAGVAAQLAGAGVRRWHVDARCTVEDAGLFSHRGDHGRTGRQAGVVVLRGADA